MQQECCTCFAYTRELALDGTGHQTQQEKIFSSSDLFSYLTEVKMMKGNKNKTQDGLKGPPLPFETRWNELPPEILVMILNKVDDSQVPKTEYRLVNSSWKAAVNSLLEQECLSIWTKWTPEMTHLLHPYPKPIMPLAGNVNCVLNFAHCPSGLIECQGNPFPSKSLSICHNHSWNYMNNHQVTWVKVDKIISKFGHHLTCFLLDGVKMTVPQLEMMFKNLTNLKALILSRISFENSQNCDVLKSYPPKLVHFRVKLETEGINSRIIQSLINARADQLLSLEAYGFLLGPASMPSAPFKQLQQLKTDFPSKLFLQLNHTCPLRYLSIYGVGLMENISGVDIINFLDKFSNTLVHLRVIFWNVDMTERPLANPLTIIPKLTNLDVGLSIPDTDRSVFMKQMFLPKFPNVKKLNFLSGASFVPFPPVNDFFREMTIASIAMAKFWEVCPKLDNISVDGVSYNIPFFQAHQWPDFNNCSIL